MSVEHGMIVVGYVYMTLRINRNRGVSTHLGMGVYRCMNPRTTLIGSVFQLRIGSIIVGYVLESIGINDDGRIFSNGAS